MLQNLHLITALSARDNLRLTRALAGLLEFRDRTFRSPDDVLAVFGLPVMALVPRVITVDEARRERRRARWRRVAVAGVVCIALVAGGYGFWRLELWKHVA